MSHFQTTDSQLRGYGFPCFSTAGFQESSKFAAGVPVPLCQGGEKVMNY